MLLWNNEGSAVVQYGVPYLAAHVIHCSVAHDCPQGLFKDFP